MTRSTPTARPATLAELNAVTELCLAAFADEAVTTWLAPDPAARQRQLREMLGASLGAAIEADALILAVAPDGEPVAASVWVPRDARSDAAQPSSSPTDDSEQSRRQAAVEAATEARRPEMAHLHLSSMATLPDHRGRGAGSAMIAAGVEGARRRRLPVYLEASTAENRRLYERFGFRDHGAPIQLPDGGPTLQPMWLAT